MSKDRKTVEIQKILDYANGFLSAQKGSVDARNAIISMIENVLMSANRYRGFRYLDETEVSAGDLPGIRWVDRVPGMVGDPRFENTDPTRRFYA